MLPEQADCLVQLVLGNGIGTGKDNGRSSFYLIVIKFAKVLHIDLDLAGIHHSYRIAQLYALYLFHSCNHIRQLAYTGGFNDNPVGGIGIQCFLQCFAEVTHQRAANTAGVHLGDIDTGILQKTAVNTNLTEFVFNQHQLLAGIGLLNHLLNQCCLTGTQKTGININCRHSFRSFQKYPQNIITHFFNFST